LSITSNNHRNNNHIVRIFPLVPHHVELQRRRRDRREMSIDGIGDPSSASSSSAFVPRRRQEAQQVGALYQGYGTHYVDLWCGTPPQRYFYLLFFVNVS
jgi:hypothetical protein